MYQRFFQCGVFILTIVAGTQTTALVNASADWFVDNYIQGSLIEPVSQVSLSRNCEPLVLVLTSDGELFVGKDKLGKFDSELERFEEPAALFNRLADRIELLNQRMPSCGLKFTGPYCGSDGIYLLAVDGVERKALASLIDLLHLAQVDFNTMIVRHRFEAESGSNWSAVQITQLVEISGPDQ